MRRLACVTAALCVAGCSIVNDPARHRVGPDGALPDAGTEAGTDAGTEAGTDAGPGADAGPPDGGPPTVSLAEICVTLAQRFCAGAPSCCTDGAADFSDCNRQMLDACQLVYNAADFPDVVTYDPVAGAALLAEGERYLMACDPDGLASWLNRRDGFFDAVRGTIAGGETCTPASMDEEDYIYAVLSCAQPGQVCRPNGGTGTWSCRSQGAAGDICYFGFECTDGRCERPGVVSAEGTCGAGEANGERCRGSDECASYACVGNNLLGPVLSRHECTALDANAAFCRYAM